MTEHPNFFGAELVTLIQVTVREGAGTSEEPYRRVLYFVDDDGAVLFVRDDYRNVVPLHLVES
jgi:hypothetical protein